MRITRLTVDNFGPFDGSRTFEFPKSGVIGVLGENGKGKSHVMLAVRYLLTGKADKGLSYLVHGEGRGPTKATVEGAFDLDGEELVVKRSISLNEDLDVEEINRRAAGHELSKTKTTASLKYGELSLRAVSDVNEKLAELTGLTDALCEDTVFVRQRAMGAEFEMTPAQVSDFVHSLCGAAVCSRAVDAANRLLSELPVEDRSEDLEARNGQLDEASAELAQSVSTLEEKNAALSELRTRFDEGEAEALLQQAEADQVRRESRRVAEEKLAQVQEELEALRTRHTAAALDNRTAQEALQAAGELSSVSAELRDLEEQERALRRRTELLEAVAKLEQEYNGHVAERKEAEFSAPERQRLETLEKQIDEIRQRRTEVQMLLVPLCEASLELERAVSAERASREAVCQKPRYLL